MAILIDEKTSAVIQGITGTEGRRAARAMLETGTKIAAGVTPGKGGQDVEGIPVYNSVSEARQHHEINASLVYVPPFAAREAVFEALDNSIPLVNCITEGVPILDTARMIAYAERKNATLVGPSSVGIISPGKSRLGIIGGPKENVDMIYREGGIGIISKSGGMTNETAWIVRQAGFGQSTVIGMGGDVLVGADYVKLLGMFEKDEQTKAVVIFGELGGTYEDEAARMLKERKFTKPLIAFIAGKFAEKMPQGMKFGHAGAFIEGRRGSPEHKIKILKEAGALVADIYDDLIPLLRKVK